MIFTIYNLKQMFVGQILQYCQNDQYNRFGGSEKPTKSQQNAKGNSQKTSSQHLKLFMKYPTLYQDTQKIRPIFQTPSIYLHHSLLLTNKK